MLPFCMRTVDVPRKHISSVWTRSFPDSKQPKTIGQHLRKRRFILGLRQSQAVHKLRVSKRTLSLWECDKVYPVWKFHRRIVGYLGYDPFASCGLRDPYSNESPVVAFLARGAIGERIRMRRLELKLTAQHCAKKLRVSVKTLHAWETGRQQPGRSVAKQLTR